MPVSFERMRSFENRRVIMKFDDDHEVIARLLSATEDIDGSHHLIYDNVEWANDPREMASAKDSTVYAEGESLVSIEYAEGHES
jgi:hypothetical protein